MTFLKIHEMLKDFPVLRDYAINLVAHATSVVDCLHRIDDSMQVDRPDENWARPYVKKQLDICEDANRQVIRAFHAFCDKLTEYTGALLDARERDQIV